MKTVWAIGCCCTPSHGPESVYFVFHRLPCLTHFLTQETVGLCNNRCYSIRLTVVCKDTVKILRVKFALLG